MTISVSQPHSGSHMPAPFSTKIAAARHNSGYTVEQLAITCGLTEQEIRALESGADSNADRIRRVAAALQTPVASII